MQRSTAFRRLLSAIALGSYCLPAQAQQNLEPRLLEYGFEQRVRTENWNNILDYDDGRADERRQIRYRSKLWMKSPVTSDIDVFVALNQETNQILVPDVPQRFDEVMVENAYVDFRKLFARRLSLRVGRQNLKRGEGFLLLDGSPGDGSRSTYFNAAVLGYSWGKSKLEAMAIHNPSNDRYLPRVHASTTRKLADRNEQALALYYTNDQVSNTSIDAYYFLKRETRDCRAATQHQYQADRHIHTAGGRLARRMQRGWSAASEFAAQWGREEPEKRIAAWGGYGYFRKAFARPGDPYVLTGYWGMSGDDPVTSTRYEGWDPLFARWPKWSDLYIYSYIREQGVGYWTNTWLWQIEAGYSPWKRMKTSFTCYDMNAFHPFNADPMSYSDGKHRGRQYQARGELNVNDHWRGHILYERHLPGSFHAGHSSGWFFRMEVIYSFRGKIPVQH
ncbi:MAG: alginate export family protein [Bryobacteraceae bacterium]|nr:alginate export family protein [Bryobacterales bacterium]MEB2362385.1 hypothetical protein [Bryobacterales bacterium]NUN00306.1 alginate export family protein [Bryobacteraceae bacterium]